jgi:hypothetical protein
MTKDQDHRRQHSPGWNGGAVARWVYDIAVQRTDTEFDLVWREVS